MEEAKKEEIKAIKLYEALSEQFHDFWKRNRDSQDDPVVKSEIDKLRKLKNAAETEMGCARRRINAIQSILKESNVRSTQLRKPRFTRLSAPGFGKAISTHWKVSVASFWGFHGK